MDKLPSCPPALYLSPPAIPILKAEPINYEYIVFTRHLCCYNHIFTIQKNREKWKLRLADHKQSYEIPIDKEVNDISMIVQSLGVYHKGLFKLEIWSKDNLIKKHYFPLLHSVIKHISDNELIIAGVNYGMF